MMLNAQYDVCLAPRSPPVAKSGIARDLYAIAFVLVFYHRHSRARMAETAKDPSKHPAPDAPERIDHRRRCTRLDHRTCCRGSRGSASLPCHTLRKRVEMCGAGSRGSASLPVARPWLIKSANPGLLHRDAFYPPAYRLQSKTTLSN